MGEWRSAAQRWAQDARRAAPAKPSAGGEPKAAPSAGNARDSLALELLNAKNWLAGRRATLQVLVSHGENGAAASGARVTARIEGAAEPSQYSPATRRDGKAQPAVYIPPPAGAQCALVIGANKGKA